MEKTATAARKESLSMRGCEQRNAKREGGPEEAEEGSVLGVWPRLKSRLMGGRSVRNLAEKRAVQC